MQLLQLQLPKILMLFINANETRGEGGKRQEKERKKPQKRNISFAAVEEIRHCL